MVLEDHIKKKQKLIPPLRAALGDRFSSYSWSLQIVPELVWITLLIRDLGPANGVETARQLAQTAALVSEKDPKPLFATMTSFSELTPLEKDALRSTIPLEILSPLRKSLGKLCAIWPDNPLSFLGLTSAEKPGDVIAFLGPILQEMYNRHSRDATLAIATVAYIGLNQDKIKVDKKVFDNNKTVFKDIEDYPNTEPSKRAGSFFRSMAPMLLVIKEKGVAPVDWVKVFWKELSMIGDCVGDYQKLPELPNPAEGFLGFVSAYAHFAHQDFKARESTWKLDLGKPQERQVILALLARQATLAIEFVSSPSIWNANVAPIILRAMADVHITLVWLLKDTGTRVSLFVNDGLGAIKLEIAHRREEASKSSKEDADQQAPYISYLENWLDSQQASFLTEVNLGSWSGKNTRVMAEEAGCLDFYSYVFQPFSAAVHSHWSHVGRINVEMCQNPTHNSHLLPIIPQLESDTHWCRMAGKYLAKSISAIDEYLNISNTPIQSYDVILDALYGEEDSAPDESPT